MPSHVLIHRFPRLASLAFLATALPALAQPSACPAHYLDGQAPDVVNARLAARLQELCYAGYAVWHSGTTKTGLVSAEHLTPERVKDAVALERRNAFHPDPNLSPADRAELADYARSGYDRGHLAPSGDMPDAAAQEESFSLANMIPQAPALNRQLWEQLESAVRAAVLGGREFYVLTGPLFAGEDLKALKGKVLVPTHVYKAVVDVATRTAAAYLVVNEATSDYRVVSLAELNGLAGLDLVPALPAEAKASAMNLPAPAPARSRSRSKAKKSAPATSPERAPATGAAGPGRLDELLKW